MSHVIEKENEININEIKIRKDNLKDTQDLEGFMSCKEVSDDLHKMMKVLFIGIGQGGGKITTEFTRLSFFTKLINTSSKDLDNVENTIKKIDGARYNKLKLEGYEGASKSIAIGLQAVKDNKKSIVKYLQCKEVLEADFVFIVGTFGGGTACGTIDIISKVVSKMRENRKTKDGKPTVGTIAAMPEADAQEEIQANAATAIEEIKLLQSQNVIGSCLLIDNEKMIDNFLKNNNNKYIDWTEYGNETVARLITEICGITCLNSNETLDKSELIDVWSSPTFLTISKMKYNLTQFCKLDSDKIVTRLNKTNIFADGYNQQLAKSCCIAMVIPEDNQCVKQTINIKRSINNYFSKSLMKKIHFANAFSRIFGTFKNPNSKYDKKTSEVIIYAVIGYEQLPQRIFEATKQALVQQKERKSIELEKEKNSSELTDLLSSIEITKTIDDSNEQSEEISEDIIDDLFSRSSEKEPSDNETFAKEDFSDLFNK